MSHCGVGVHKAEIKVAAALVFSGGLNRGGSTLSGPSGCRQNSLACGYSMLMICFFKASYGRVSAARQVLLQGRPRLS